MFLTLTISAVYCINYDVVTCPGVPDEGWAINKLIATTAYLKTHRQHFSKSVFCSNTESLNIWQWIQWTIDNDNNGFFLPVHCASYSFQLAEQERIKVWKPSEELPPCHSVEEEEKDFPTNSCMEVSRLFTQDLCVIMYNPNNFIFCAIYVP